MSISERGNIIELETQVLFPVVNEEEVSANVEEQNSEIPRTTEEDSTVSIGMSFTLQDVALKYHQKIIIIFKYL